MIIPSAAGLPWVGWEVIDRPELSSCPSLGIEGGWRARLAQSNKKARVLTHGASALSVESALR